MKQDSETIKDIKQRISATYDIIIGLECSIETMEQEIRNERRKTT
jgi:hypothetical protein